MKKRAVFIFLVLFLLSLNVFSGEFQLNGYYGFYSKDYDLFKELYGKNKNTFGLGVDYFFLKFSGIYLDASRMSTSGESSYHKLPLSYSEIHLSAGAKLRFTLFRFSPLYELNLYLKSGVLYISYAETFEEKVSGNTIGFTAGGGVVFWLKKIGVGLEIMKNIASKSIDIQGLDTSESISFSGLRIVLKGVLRF